MSLLLFAAKRGFLLGVGSGGANGRLQRALAMKRAVFTGPFIDYLSWKGLTRGCTYNMIDKRLEYAFWGTKWYYETVDFISSVENFS